MFLAGLLFWCSLASLLPTLPLYLQDIGASNQQLGWVMGSFAFGLLAFRPWLGQRADRKGRKPILLLGIVVAAIAPLGYMATQSLWALTAIRIFHGISIAAFTTAFSALVVDIAPPQNRGEVLGYMTLVNPIGVALGPAIGGFLQASAGYPPLFLMATGLAICALIGCSQIDVPPLQQNLSLGETPSRTLPFWRLLGSSRLRIPAMTMLLIGLAFGTLSTFVPLLIESAKVNLNPGLFYTAAALASFTARLTIGRASDRYGRGRFITIGILFYSVSMFVICFANQASLFLLAGFLEGAGAGIFLPMMIALIADRSTTGERGRTFGLLLGGFDLGIALAGPVLGSVADQVGYRSLFALASTLALLAFVLFIAFNSKNLRYSLQFSLGAGRDIYALEK